MADDPIQQLAEAIRDARGRGNKQVRLTLPEAVRLLSAARSAARCTREHVPYESFSRSDNRFFGDENNG